MIHTYMLITCLIFSCMSCHGMLEPGTEEEKSPSVQPPVPLSGNLLSKMDSVQDLRKDGYVLGASSEPQHPMASLMLPPEVILSSLHPQVQASHDPIIESSHLSRRGANKRKRKPVSQVENASDFGFDDNTELFFFVSSEKDTLQQSSDIKTPSSSGVSTGSGLERSTDSPVVVYGPELPPLGTPPSSSGAYIGPEREASIDSPVVVYGPPKLPSSFSRVLSLDQLNAGLCRTSFEAGVLNYGCLVTDCVRCLQDIPSQSIIQFISHVPINDWLQFQRLLTMLGEHPGIQNLTLRSFPSLAWGALISYLSSDRARNLITLYVQGPRIDMLLANSLEQTLQSHPTLSQIDLNGSQLPTYLLQGWQLRFNSSRLFRYDSIL